MYGLNREPWMKRAGQDMQLYQVIRIDGNRLSYEARTAVGERYDSFELVKRPGLANELIEKLPADPEAMTARRDTRTTWLAAGLVVLLGLLLWMRRAARRTARARSG
jgi:hypothetical protein